MARIYCAGPLFNPAERDEMAIIAKTLEQAGHTTFLPHRDGLEFAELQPLILANGPSAPETVRILEQAIFALDVHVVLDKADAVVANLNGRVPDEGMVVEAALAWHSGKPLVFYKSDVRSLVHGADNPLLRGLTSFEAVASIADIPAALEQQLQQTQNTVASVRERGSKIQQLLHQHSDRAALARAILKEFP